MPIIARAIKKLRHDHRRAIENAKTRDTLRMLVKKARKSPTTKTLSAAFSALDKAAKHNVVHPNKASRLKSRLSRLLKKK